MNGGCKDVKSNISQKFVYVYVCIRDQISPWCFWVLLAAIMGDTNRSKQTLVSVEEGKAANVQATLGMLFL